ncbi:MAG: undecaprenyl-diphosphatase [Selenomonadales bacterium]|jgi:undecaprenyl-diphosphatase uppP|nr:undecaprenyl-diphosphate phosphatase [Clostridiales bacterium]PWM01226.1 MAG: undecaprenyl-diphosphatase [Selenomonadales bacterium]
METVLELLKAVFLGIIQGITEWLPISSTGHMILANEIINLSVSAEFMEMFEVVIQLGSILAVVVLFFHKLNPFSPKKSSEEKRDTFSLWGKVIIGIIPAGVIGLLFDKQINSLFYNSLTIAITLIIYGVLFILVENRNKKLQPKVDSVKQISWQLALAIGCAQVLALIPGTSRSGATIIGAMLFGLSRTAAAEFSFFLAVPVMFGASALKLLKFGFDFTGMELAILLIGCVTAFLVSLAAIRFLMNFIKKHDFKPFGYYRIALGIIILIVFGLLGKL